MNGEGHVRIAGLGTAFVLSTTPAADAYRSSHGTAPEFIDTQRWGSHNTEATTASDVYAFAVLAWEVRMELVAFLGKMLNEMEFIVRFFPGELRFPKRGLSQGLTRC